MGPALWPLLVQAGGSAAPPMAAASATDARTWLQRIHSAASQRNYQGTLVVSANGAVSSSRIAHYCEGKQTFERIDMLNGQPQRVYRHNDQVTTLWPTHKVARVEQRDAVALFPAVLSGSEEQLFDRYEMLAEGSDRVAGLDTAVFLLRPRDTQRFAQRLWADQSSGLLLRADVLGADGRVLESAAFSEVTIGVRSQPETVIAPMKKLEGYRVLRSTPQRTALEAEGWQLKAPVAGFKQISCVKRSLESAGDGEAASTDALQAIFSDGLTHVSVFIEPFRPDRHRPGAAAVGATHTLMQPLGPHWVTVMGDVPMGTLKQFAAALERLR
jgi:sigma-E factor negative regulatory protein RseB